MLDLEFYLIRYFINQYRHVKLHADDLDRRDPATTQTSYKNNELSFDISGVGKTNLEGVRRERVCYFWIFKTNSSVQLFQHLFHEFNHFFELAVLFSK